MRHDGLHAVANERRATERFPIERHVRYKLAGRSGVEREGDGTTVNMSSRGVLFHTTAAITPGRKIELSISWPAQLNENCALRFVAHGRVVRYEANAAAIEIGRYEFKTQRVEKRTGPIPIA